MTVTIYTVKRAYGADCRPVGWDLFADGVWCQRFALKRDAVAAQRDLEETE